MDNFVTWTMFAEYATFVTLVYMFVEFTKELPVIELLKTKYYSAIVAFTMLVLVNLHAGTFAYWDIMLYTFSAIVISLTSNGLSDFTNPVDKNKTE